MKDIFRIINYSKKVNYAKVIIFAKNSVLDVSKSSAHGNDHFQNVIQKSESATDTCSVTMFSKTFWKSWRKSWGEFEGKPLLLGNFSFLRKTFKNNLLLVVSMSMH